MAEMALEFVNTNDMLMVSARSTRLDLEIEDDNLYRFVPIDVVQVKALAYMLMSWGIEYVVVADQPGASDEGFSEAFEETYESLGGEILGSSLDIEELDQIVGDAIALHGSERVGLAALLWVPPFIIADSAYYENIGNVTWMGLGDQVDPYIIEVVGGQQTKLRLFSAWPSTSPSSRWNEFEADYENMMGYSPQIWEGATYDAIWCMVLSVLQSGSADPMKVKEVLPEVATKYYGVTGGCTLNSAGDRVPHIYDIWGFAQIEDEHTYIKYGEYNAQTDEAQWFDSALVSQNITRPGN
jgi:ABC-type branched-subunit amino acid transport system substrate-binding protein